LNSARDTETKEDAGPLAGMRVLDFSWLLPGPFCTMQLADLGAEVIKVESPGGDYARDMLPGLFAAANRNKRSIIVDLKANDAADLVEALVRKADVVVEGFRPGVADRLGIGFSRLSQINPRLVYASISGYGAKGPMAQTVGHDVNYLAMAGVLSIPGQWGAGSARSGLPVGDIAAAMSTALAIVACVMESRATGRGRYLNAAMLPSLMNWSQVRVCDHLNTDDGRWPHLNPLNGLYETKDGRQISLAVIEPKFFARFCALAGCEDLLETEEYRSFTRNHDRAAGEALRDRLRALISTRTADDWNALLEGESVPFAPVLTPKEALSLPQLAENGLDTTPPPGLPRGYFPFPIPGLGAVRARPAPEKGEHTQEILNDTGLSGDTIAKLRKEGVVASLE